MRERCASPHHHVLLRSGHAGQHVHAVSREISFLIGSLVNAVRPAGVEHLLACFLVQHDQVSFPEAQECRFLSS